MDEGKIKRVKLVLYIVAIILIIIMIWIVIGGITEYRQGMRGYSDRMHGISAMEGELGYGEYEWLLRDLKEDDMKMQSGEETGDFAEIRNLAEYYQWSILARSYDYIGDRANAEYYAKKAETSAENLGKYREHREGIDEAISWIG